MKRNHFPIFIFSSENLVLSLGLLTLFLQGKNLSYIVYYLCGGIKARFSFPMTLSLFFLLFAALWWFSLLNLVHFKKPVWLWSFLSLDGMMIKKITRVHYFSKFLKSQRVGKSVRNVRFWVFSYCGKLCWTISQLGKSKMVVDLSLLYVCAWIPASWTGHVTERSR